MPNQLELVIAGVIGDDMRVATHNQSYRMQTNSRFGKFWTRIKATVVQDVPPGLEECESCREVNCTQERWLTCARRLAAEAETEARAGRNYAVPSVTGRTDEMPGIFTTDSPQAQPDENEVAEGDDRRKKISFSGD
jgi:hypothetical protein